MENRDIHGQDLSFARLENAFLYRANLMGADLSGSNLTDANLDNANLIDAIFDHAIVKGATFNNNGGITESLKRDLIRRGAIFIDDLGAVDRELTKV